VSVRVHPFVQDADDLAAVGPDALVDDVLTDTKAPVARADVAALGSKPGVVRKSGNAFVQGIELEVSLVGTPALEGVLPDVQQIVFRGSFLVDFIHCPGSVRPLAWPDA
jgi:hypothetical protein